MKPFPAKRILKIALISFGCLLAAALLAVGLAFFIVLSPKHLTPLVNQLASNNLRAEVRIRKVDFTLSTFPHLGLELKDGFVVSHALRDSAFETEDTLCAFHRCVVGINFKEYTRNKKLSFATVELDSVNCRLFTDADGLSNYQIFGIDTLSNDSTAAQIPPMEIKRFRIGNVDVSLQDQRSGTEARIGNLAMDGEGGCDTAGMQASINFEVSDIKFSQANQKIVNNIPLKGKIQTAYNYQERKGSLLNSSIQVKQLELDLQGDFFMDTAGRLGMDMKVDLQTNSLKEMLDMIPPKYLQTQGVQADGQINMQGHIYGCFAEKEMPEVDMHLELENGRAHYEGMPYPIDTLVVRLTAHLAPGKKKPSYINIEDLVLVAKDVDVVSVCKVKNLFSDPSVDLKLSTKVNLDRISDLVPLREGLALGGIMDADIDGNFRLSYIKKANYGKIQARGKFDMEDVFFNDTLSGIYWAADAQCRFKGGKYLGAAVVLNKMRGTMPGVRTYVDSLEMKAVTQRITERSENTIVPIACAVNYSRLFAKLGDSLRVFSMASAVKAKVVPEPENPHKPLVTIDFQTDSLFVQKDDYRARLANAKINARLTRHTPTSWWPTVDANLQRMAITMPQLSEPLQIRRFKGSLDGKDLEIEKARFRLGESRLSISGKIWDISAITLQKGKIKADLLVKSRMIDCNQLLNILAQPIDTAQLEAKAGAALADKSIDCEVGADYVADSLQQIRLLMVPDNLDLRVDIDAQKVYYDRSVFDSIRGKIRVRNKAVNLRELQMRAWNADMVMNLVYANRNRQRADIGADISLNGIRVDSLVRSFSALDSTLPMLRSFEGTVNLQATASAQLDSNVNIQLPSLTAALNLHGDSLVVLDGETFALISEKLKFKNKKRNLIDSLSVVVTVQDDKITVYPFVIEIDKYKAAVGGEQDMDLNYRYHITLLAVPPLVKMVTRDAVTLHGNFNESKRPRLKFGHPLYKNIATPAFVKQIDESRLALGKQIMLQFEGWMNRERRRLSEVNFPKMEIPIDSTGESEVEYFLDTIQ